MSTPKPHAKQPPPLATVTSLPSKPVEHRTRDLLHTLDAADITATDAQVNGLARQGMTGLGCWTTCQDLRDLARAANQHLSIARRVQHAVEQSDLRVFRKETTR